MKIYAVVKYSEGDKTIIGNKFYEDKFDAMSMCRMLVSKKPHNAFANYEVEQFDFVRKVD
jgi:hypothetical protein